MIKEHTCCFFGHRKIEVTDKLVEHLNDIIEKLITDKSIDTFLFGSKSEFDTLCLKVVTELKIKYPHIKRIYVRAEYPYINDDYRAYLLKSYDDTYYPDKMLKAGRAAYVERNYEMIDNSSCCVVYYDESYNSPKRKTAKKSQSNYQPKSGTRLAFDYAEKTNKNIINVINELKNIPKT